MYKKFDRKPITSLFHSLISHSHKQHILFFLLAQVQFVFSKITYEFVIDLTCISSFKRV